MSTKRNIEVLVNKSFSLFRLGKIYRELQDYDNAKQNLEESIKITENILETMATKHPDALEHISYAYEELGMLYLDTGDLDKAENFLQRSIGYLDKLYEIIRAKQGEMFRLRKTKIFTKRVEISKMLSKIRDMKQTKMTQQSSL